MGILRKAISGTLALGTGGLSLGVVQFRSDTERATLQTKKLRQELQRQHAEAMAIQAREQAELNAALAASALQRQPPPAHLASEQSPPSPQYPVLSAAERVANLARLSSLRDAGVLTDDEFERERAELLKPA